MAYTNILLCGGSGFIGSNFIHYLHRNYQQYRIYNLDLLTYAGNPENLADLADSPRYQFFHGDIGDKPLVEDLFSKHRFDVVINFAAESHVDRSIVNAFQFIKTNIQGAYTLLEAVRCYKIPRFIYISTDEIYGDIPMGVRSREEYPLAPTNSYAASKASADLIVQSFIKTHRVPAIIARASSNYGPYQYPEKITSLVITNLLEDKKIPLHGNGAHLRNWLHVEDFCHALDLMMHKGADGGIYNVGGEEKSNMEIIKLFANLLDKDHRTYIDPATDRPGADFRYAVDDTRIRKELGWEPRHAHADAAVALVDWYRKNRGWWMRIKEKKEFLDHYEKQKRGIYDL